MLDIEKVIRGLEACRREGCTAESCPYAKEKRCVELLCYDALILLREQEPVSVGFTNGVYHCGNCGEPLFDNNIYCFKCGRKVEWGDDGDG